MKIFLHQFELNPESQVNFQTLRNVFEQNPGVDLIVAPEVFTSGFRYSRLQESYYENRRYLEQIAALCESYSTAFCGTFFWSEKKNYYNRAFFISDEGEIITKYDKINLIPAFREDEFLTPGKKISGFEYKEMRLGIAICYDLRFPELFRRYAKQEVDLMIIPAQWPASRAEHMTALARARAIENQCYVVLANTVGGSEKTPMAGSSMAFDPKGKVLLDLSLGREGRETEIHLAEILKYRSEFPALYQYSRPRIFSEKLTKVLHRLRGEQGLQKNGRDGSNPQD